MSPWTAHFSSLLLACAQALPLGAGEIRHWAFQPLEKTSPPRVETGTRLDANDPLNPIDGFVARRLQEAGLEPAPEADASTLIRRLYLDMHGLVPPPEKVAEFQASTDPGAYAALVEEVLASPRYGERWAQHWLDIVRYADTHGFEVNTPRPYAWPYRDYVIQAFNQDKPYPQFVFEQLAGDAVGQDAATGFLVAAAVLLPGQIGQDDASKRLARQDALHEIVTGVGETFLGLTVGCARCHDHKFDPITQRDYYALQAFFAGVDYGDRPLHDEAARQRARLEKHLESRIRTLTEQLQPFQPAAFPGRTLLLEEDEPGRVILLKPKAGQKEIAAGTRPGGRDDPGNALRTPNLSRGHYLWWTNQPGEDLMTYLPGVSGQFDLWLSWGAHGGDTHTRDARYLLDQDGDLDTKEDQIEVATVNQRRRADDGEVNLDKLPLWSGLFHAGTHQFQASSRLVLRGGQSGQVITADAILLQERLGDAPCPAPPRLRDPARHDRNVERFAPIQARYLRFTALATQDQNRHEPCLDELEIYGPGSEINLALASQGAKATSSGNFNDPQRHKLEHIHDGQYGNERSWISSTPGGGWVQIELAKPALVDRVVWGRDRHGQFKDRLAVRYRIEAGLQAAPETLVAASEDREPLGTPHDEISSLMRHLPPGAPDSIRGLVRELAELQERQQALEPFRMVFGGIFREPDATHLLRRGDPEQPGERVAPALLRVLGGLTLAIDEPEQSRRVALANWLARPENPLTARVMANRVWQFHFGRGLVDTPNDFGVNGSKPSHPELLDWLAAELVRSGGSVKQLHRWILRSATYRRCNRMDPKAQAADPDNRLLWRFPTRRLEAEAIRDNLLRVNGRLNLHTGGAGFDFFQTRGGLNGFPPVDQFGPEGWRRMIYAHKIRMEPVPVFGAFDCPDAGQSTPRRHQSLTAIQALNLFNSPFVAEQSEAFAARVQAEMEGAGEVRRQVGRAFELALGRPPTPAEAAAAEASVRDHGLATLCRALYNCNEFLFLP